MQLALAAQCASLAKPLPALPFFPDRHGIPINAVPVSQPHLTPANALQYAQFRADTGAPLLYRVVPPGHENEPTLQTFPGSQVDPPTVCSYISVLLNASVCFSEFVSFFVSLFL